MADMSPYRAPAAELAPRTIPRARLGRLFNAFGLTDFEFVRRWLGGRWELWMLPFATWPGTWFRVVEWTDRDNIVLARERNGIHSSIWISREDWCITFREEHR